MGLSKRCMRMGLEGLGGYRVLIEGLLGFVEI